MEKILIVVDMQKDFVDGSLGTAEAQDIVSSVKNEIESFEGEKKDFRKRSGISKTAWPSKIIWIYLTLRLPMMK